MNHKVHGQHEGRDARLKETANWLGATPVGHGGEPLPIGPSEDELELDVVQNTVEMIRSSLDQDVTVRCTEMHPPNVNMIKQSLSDEERERVVFDFDEMAGGQVL